jgi:multiple sugar transport system ATP-binding protein
MAAVRFEKVRKQFGGVEVIKELDLVIEDGEFFSFVGPSGCGKSTILNMIAGLEPVTEGRIYFDGSAVNDLSPSDRDVAMVFQSYALYPHMTVGENIAFPLKMKKAGEDFIDEEVRRVAALLGIGQLLFRKPKELSGGQRQRVALGRAIIRRPKVFLMDEPLSNLDARLRTETRGELKKLYQELGTTTVYVTHDQAEALGLSGRIGVLDRGEIQQVGTPNEVYRRPANIFVAGFIGSPTMNFIRGRIRSSDPLEIECNGMLISPKTDRTPEHEAVVIGIRPEDIAVTAGGPAGETLAVNVSFTESAGPVDWVDFIWNGVRMKGAAKPDSGLSPGGPAFIEFPQEKVVVFDETSGMRL